MNKNIKTIILGFALMHFGGILQIICYINNSIPNVISILSYSFYLGLIMIILGLYNEKPKNKDSK